jgi:hypothetical protein
VRRTHARKELQYSEPEKDDTEADTKDEQSVSRHPSGDTRVERIEASREIWHVTP